MLNAKTGTSTKKDAALAGKEAAQQVKEIADNMKLAFVYSGVQYDQKTLLNAISAELPGIPLIGNTSFTGVITQDGFVTGDDGFVGIMGIADPDLKVGVAGMPSAGDRKESRPDGAEKRRYGQSPRLLLYVRSVRGRGILSERHYGGHRKSSDVRWNSRGQHHYRRMADLHRSDGSSGRRIRRFLLHGQAICQ